MTIESVSPLRSTSACVTSDSANLTIGWAGTQALTSAKRMPALLQAGVQQVTLWLRTSRVFLHQVYCGRPTPSGTTARDKIRSHRELGSLGRCSPQQVALYLEADMASTIP